MYERPINPPEPHLEDLTVNVTGYTRGTVDQITSTIGGDAHWNGDPYAEDGFRGFSATTIVEDCEDYSTAEDIVHNLFSEHLDGTVDIDNLIIKVETVEEYEPDWYSIAKDERAEAAIDW